MAWQPDYATSAELKSYLRIPAEAGEDTRDDAELGLALSAAARSIDKACGRQFGNVGSTSTLRTYTAVWYPRRARYVVEIDDLYAATPLTVTVSDVAVTDFTLEPVNALADGKPYTLLVFNSGGTDAANAIDITSTKWGWSAVPNTIKNANLLQAARLFKRRDAPFGIAGSSEMGSELRLLAKVDPDVEVMVASYRRWWAAF